MKNLVTAAVIALSLFGQAAQAGEPGFQIQKVTVSENLSVDNISSDFLEDGPEFAKLEIKHNQKELTLQFVKMVGVCPRGAFCFMGPREQVIREIKLPVVKDVAGNFDGEIVAQRDARPVDGDFQKVTVKYVTAADGGPTFARVSYEVETSGFTPDGKIFNFFAEMSGNLSVIE